MGQSALEYRSWGTVEAVSMREGHQIQQFTVIPGARLPLRVNDYQCEHWVIIKGIGRTRLDSQSSLMDEGSSIFIPARATHAIENIGDETLRVIAVQYGPEWASPGSRQMTKG